jgi:predicted ATPase
MIEIVKPSDTIKTEEMGKTWKEILTKKWQVDNKFIDVSADSTDIIKVIVQRCAGNPLLCLYFYVSLLQNSFITIDTNGLLMSTGKLQHCQKLNDFVTVPVPRFSIKNNIAMIDKFLKTINNKPQKRPGELEACVKAIVMMKAATVLGDEFDLKALKAVNPLRYPETIDSLK